MKKWVVKFEDIKTVDTLEEMGILSYKPLFHQDLKFVFIETDMTKDEILKIKSITNCREESIGTLWV